MGRFDVLRGLAGESSRLDRGSCAACPTLMAANSPASPPQQTQPFSATRHLGEKGRRLMVSVSLVLVSSRWMLWLASPAT